MTKNNFINDPEKMSDFTKVSKSEFLKSYPCVTAKEYSNTFEIYKQELENKIKISKEQKDLILKLIELDYIEAKEYAYLEEGKDCDEYFKDSYEVGNNDGAYDGIGIAINTIKGLVEIENLESRAQDVHV